MCGVSVIGGGCGVGVDETIVFCVVLETDVSGVVEKKSDAEGLVECIKGLTDAGGAEGFGVDC